MNEHNEPWEHIQDHLVRGSDGRIMIQCDEYENLFTHLRHVVACVNVCAGFPTEIIEQIEGAKTVENVLVLPIKGTREIDQYKFLKDALEALIDCSPHTDEWNLAISRARELVK